MPQSRIDVPAELAAMEKMAAKDLRAKYEELYGEASPSGNRQWLLRRCAWRLQSLVEGTLSEKGHRDITHIAPAASIPWAEHAANTPETIRDPRFLPPTALGHIGGSSSWSLSAASRRPRRSRRLAKQVRPLQ